MLNIGIVGTGIAGLTAGWLLERSGAQVTLFECHPDFGMDVHSIDFPIEPVQTPTEKLRIDVPPRMFNRAQWPNLFRLYEALGVETTTVDPSKCFGEIGGKSVFKLGKSFRPGFSWALLFRSMPRRVISDIRRMERDVSEFLHAPSDESLKDFLARNRYSPEFIVDFLYPALSSTVCTCTYRRLDNYPASVLLPTMLNLIQPEGLFRTRHGTRDVVKRLAAKIQNCRLGISVATVAQKGETVEITTQSSERISFDHLIVATESNTAIRIIDDLTSAERDVLATFPSEEISVVVHTDPALMPERQKDWCNFNLISNQEKTAAMCSIWMNRFYPEREFAQPVFQTIMPICSPRDESVIRLSTMRRAVVDSASLRANSDLQRIHEQPNRRIWFCGSYSLPGTPLLESGVVSSMKIAKRLGATWTDSFAAQRVGQST